MTSQINVALIHKLCGSLIFFLDIFMGGNTTRHWQTTSGRLLQELNVCTVEHPTPAPTVPKPVLAITGNNSILTLSGNDVNICQIKFQVLISLKYD